MRNFRQDSPAEVVVRFYTWLDERRYENMMELLDPAATWHRQGKLLQGRQQVLQALLQRPSSKRIRHVITNSITDAHSPAECTTTAYQTVYQQPDIVEGQPLRPTLASKISVVTANLCMDGAAGWRIVSLSSSLGLDLRGEE